MCAVRDGCSRRVIGWAIGEYLHTDLVQAALEMAVAMRGQLAEQVILQSSSRIDAFGRHKPPNPCSPHGLGGCAASARMGAVTCIDERNGPPTRQRGRIFSRLCRFCAPVKRLDECHNRTEARGGA